MIPLSTTTVAVHRITAGHEYDEPYGGDEPLNRDIVHTGVRAVIDAPSGVNGTVEFAGGQQNVLRARLICDPVDIVHTDVVADEGTGRYYRIQWLLTYPGSHNEAGLYDAEGEV